VPTDRERNFIARTAIVASVATLGLGFVLSAWDPVGIEQDRVSEATAIGLCINQEAFQARADGLTEEDGDASLRNLREVLELGIARYDRALNLLGEDCSDVLETTEEDK